MRKIEIKCIPNYEFFLYYNDFKDDGKINSEKFKNYDPFFESPLLFIAATDKKHVLKFRSGSRVSPCFVGL